MDLTVEAEAFGCSINFYENDIPTVAAGIVNDELTVNNLAVPEPSEQRTKEYIKAVRLSSAHFTAKPVFAVCIGPFSLAGRLFGMTEIMTSLLFEPEIIITLLEKCSAFLNKYIQEFKRAGANGIIMAEPAAGLLSSDQCDTFSSDFIRKIVKDVQDDKFLFILHNCGNTGHVTGSMVSTGARALHFGNRIDLAKVLDEVPGDIIVMGNIDPAGIFRMGDPGSMTSACNDLLCSNADHRNFVISSGCEIPPGVSDENYRAFFDAVRKTT